MKRAPKAAIAMTVASCLVFAQEFEVASIKPSNPAGPGRGMRANPGRIDMTGVTLSFLVEQAYSVREFQIAGGPGWIKSDRYDIAVKLPDKDGAALPGDFAMFSEEQRNTWILRRQAMLQALLADRFQLRMHRENRDLPRYVLTVSKSGLKKQSADSKTDSGMIRMGKGSLSGSQIPVPDLILALSQILDRTIVDQTGLHGKFDVDLKWTPDLAPNVDAATANMEGPTIFTALQEQLGLKLEANKGPVEVIVIDAAGKPAEN
jgi:bla regulator protein blaR1